MICPVCGSKDSEFFARGWDCEYLTTEEIFSYYRCGNCSVVFLPNPPVDRLSQIYPPSYYSFSEGHDSLLYRIKSWLERRMFSKLLDHIEGEKLRALDVGGGDGWMLNVAREADNRLVETDIVDIDQSAKTRAEENGHTFHLKRVEDFSSDKKFDLILLLNLLEHVSDPKELMHKLASLLSKRGLILIKTPNTDTLDRYIFQNHNWGGLHCPRHWVLFNRRSLSNLMDECGFEIVKLSYTQGAPQWAASILGWLSDMRIIYISKERPMHRHFLWTPVMAIMAGFDFLRLPFSKTTQMFCILRLRDGQPSARPRQL